MAPKSQKLKTKHKVKAKKHRTASVPPQRTASQSARVELELKDMDIWLNNVKSFAKNNPGALLVGGMAVVLAILLHLP